MHDISRSGVLMRVYRLVVFGRELFAWEVDGALEVVVTTTAEDEEDDEDDCPEISSGSSHNFERDPNPLDPNDRYDWEFGFHPPGEP
jgi:hypothetical protein